MANERSIGDTIVAGELVIQNLLSEAILIGGIYTMGYDECFVITNDLWKKNAGGVPQHCFLLATAMTPGEAPDLEDEEVILLRVIGPGALPSEAELVQVREQAMREMIVTRGIEAAAEPPAILDVLTRNEIQFSGVKAKILGTFYDIEVNGKPLLTFGSDVDTYYSASRYKVYKPVGESLAIITSYPEITEQEMVSLSEGITLPTRVQIGVVRYASTDRRKRLRSGDEPGTEVRVKVNVDDFIALKTAIFGMTRLGKSNTMKIIATAVFQYAVETGQTIGQLLFDPAGEYANITVQDQTALVQIGNEYVTIFRYGATGTEEGIRPLTTNFFSDETIDVTWSIIAAGLRARSTTDYVNSFLAANVIGPDDIESDRSAYERARRRRSLLYAILLKANFNPPSGFTTTFGVNEDIIQAVNTHLNGRRPEPFETRRGYITLNETDLIAFWDCFIAARENIEDDGTENVFRRWIDSELDVMLRVYRGSGITGYRLLEPLRAYHSIARIDDYAEEVLAELIDGKIVIVDLSLGTESVLQYCSERIVNFILEDAARRFAEGQELHRIQIFIEEAHRLFNRERMQMPEERDPYVRLAKEAAKFKIGLIYATQEVSSVDSQVLSNTSNWIVTHLNNTTEVRELSKYYDFADFAELTLKAEDVGFARIKTKSGRYIIPVQIDKFDRSMIDAAREATLERVETSGENNTE